MNTERKKELSDLALEFLNEEGQDEVTILLAEDDERGAQFYLLGALDRVVAEGDLTDEESPGFYRKIGLPLEDIARFRQQRTP